VIADEFDLSGAVCAQTDAEVFFPEKGGQHTLPKSMCLGRPEGHRRTPPCPCRFTCLLIALEHRDPYGVWGGMSEKERRALAREPLQGCEPPPPPVQRRPTCTRGRAQIHPLSNGRRNHATRV
jgi:hypothetical protein